MEPKQESTQRIKHIAEATLAQFEKVADAAQIALRADHTVGMGALANVNAFTDDNAISRLNRIDQANRETP